MAGRMVTGLAPVAGPARPLACRYGTFAGAGYPYQKWPERLTAGDWDPAAVGSYTA